MSNAIHSEVVELVLSVEKFERQVARTGAFMDRLRQLVEKPMEIVGRFDKVINEAKTLTMSLNEAKRAQEQLNSAMIAGQIRAQEQMRKTQRENKIIVDEMIKQGVTLPGGEYRGTMSASQLSQLQRRIAEQDVTNELRKQLDLMNRQAAAEKLLVEETKRRALAQVQSSMGYRVGSTVLSGRTGALMTAAASGSFLMGASNLGAMFYMMERLSYATGVGHQNLSVFAEKLGLVKLTGEGAEVSIARFGSRLVALSGMAAIAATALGTMFVGRRVNQELAEMSTLLADASVNGSAFRDMLDATANSAIKLSATFNTSMVDVVKGFKLALSTGINADELERFGEIALTLGKGLGASLEESTSILTTFKDAFAGTVEDTVEYSDVLFNAINVGKFNVAQLNANVGRVAVTAAEAGVSFKDMMAALATLNRVGMSTSQAITSLNQMIVSIVNPTDKAKKAFDSLGIQYGHAALKGRDLIQVIGEMNSKVGGNADLWGEMFSEERGRRGAIGLAANPGLFTSNREEMEKTGTAAVAAARAMDTFGQNIGKIWTTISSIVQAAGSDLLNVANRVFFPGGALGKDTLTEVGHALETVMFFVKEVGVLLIGIAGVAMNAFSVLAGTFKLIAQILKRDFLGALNTVEATLTTIFQRTTNSITAFWEVAATSGDRINAFYETAKRGATTTSDKLDSTATKTRELTDAFAGLSDTTVAGAKNVKTSYDEIGDTLDSVIKKAKMARIEAAAAQLEFAAPEGVFSLPGVKGSYQLGMYKLALANMRHVESKISSGDPGTIANWDELMKEREAAQEEFTKRQIALMELVDKKRAEYSEKARQDYIKEQMIKEGVIAPDGTVGPSGTSPQVVEQIAGALKELNDAQAKLFSDTLPKLSDMTEGALQSRAEQLKQHIANLETATIGIRESTTDVATQKSALEQLYTYRKQSMEELRKIEVQQGELVQKRAVAEIERANTIYKLKMKLYEEEGKKLGEITKKLNAHIASVRGVLSTPAFRGDEQKRRYYQEESERAYMKVKGATTPEDVIATFDVFKTAVDNFKSAADASNFGDRADRMEKEWLGELLPILERAKLTTDAKRGTIKDAEKAAARSRDQTLDENKVYAAVRQESMSVVKEALDTAATHGLTVNGSLNSVVEIKNVPINIDVNKFKSLVSQLVEEKFNEIRGKEGKGEDGKPGDNLVPVGGAF